MARPYAQAVDRPLRNAVTSAGKTMGGFAF